jgi:hypothetical protein
MKRIFVATLVLLLLAVTVTPALAYSEAAARGRGPFALVGQITSVDAVTRTVSVSVLRGNMLVRPYIGQTVTLQTTGTTRFQYKTGITVTRITFADLKVGQYVSANGPLLNDTWTASRITVGASLIHLP